METYRKEGEGIVSQWYLDWLISKLVPRALRGSWEVGIDPLEEGYKPRATPEEHGVGVIGSWAVRWPDPPPSCDELTPDGFSSNSSGGVLGGISSGQDLLASIALKPTSSLRLPGHTVNRAGEPVEIITKGRHDPCVGLRATPIAEAMTAIIVLDHYLRHRAQNADVNCSVPVITNRK